MAIPFHRSIPSFHSFHRSIPSNTDSLTGTYERADRDGRKSHDIGGCGLMGLGEKIASLLVCTLYYILSIDRDRDMQSRAVRMGVALRIVSIRVIICLQ